MRQKLLKQFILHYALVMGVALLGFAFMVLGFFYAHFYQPLLQTADIYELKGGINAITINTARFDEADDALKQKTSRPATSLDGLRSPF